MYIVVKNMIDLTASDDVESSPNVERNFQRLFGTMGHAIKVMFYDTHLFVKKKCFVIKIHVGPYKASLIIFNF